MSLSTRYNPKETESKWYEYWEKKNYFHSEPDDREPFTIVIPPPNVTGKLHMGHMLNNTIQDILIRRARLLGKNACWVPGTDHASIATEAKVPVLLGYLDYSTRRIGIGGRLDPSGDIEADLKICADFYAPIKGRWPERTSPVRFSK